MPLCGARPGGHLQVLKRGVFETRTTPDSASGSKLTTAPVYRAEASEILHGCLSVSLSANGKQEGHAEEEMCEGDTTRTEWVRAPNSVFEIALPVHATQTVCVKRRSGQ